MPYIKQIYRKNLDSIIEDMTAEIKINCSDKNGSIPDMPGLINYTFSKILYNLYNPISYSKINSVIGVLECVKQEFYDKVARPYENIKCEENGEVFE